jgi:hypothetical protein
MTDRTIALFEGRHSGWEGANAAEIRAALEGAGIEFLEGDSPGVRLRKAPP